MRTLRLLTQNAQLTGCFLLGICFLFLPAPASPQEFAATTLGDFGSVTVMQVTGNYNATLPDGSTNSPPREAIAKEFFRIHKDDVDFLVVFSNFNFQMPDSIARAFYLGVKNDTQGIGQPLFDNTSLFGSAGKLQGTIDLGNIANLFLDSLDPAFEETLDILSHEQMHRWGAYVKFQESRDELSEALLGRDASHWSFLLDSYGSVLYGNKWLANGNGTFTSFGTRKYYSPLDLYLMGFHDKTQVPPMLLIDNPDIEASRLPETGATIDGTARYVSIEDIIAAEGERIPNAEQAQRYFKAAFIFVTLPGTFILDDLYGIEELRKEWSTRFSVLTEGQAIVEVASTLKEDVPTNPGVMPPFVTPRSLPYHIEDGVRWLMDNQKPDGSWMDLTQTAGRDTAEVVSILKHFVIAEENYSSGLRWLHAAPSDNMDYLARKIESIFLAGQDPSGLISELLSRRNPDGGWGSNINYMSNPADSSLALKSLARTGFQEQTVLMKAIEFLKEKQNIDGGWGIDDGGSSVQTTANVLQGFLRYRGMVPLEDPLERGTAWILQRQNPDGGFGNSPSTVYDTSLAVCALTEMDASRNSIHNGLKFIRDLQSGDGSWNRSAYETALATHAVWKAGLAPDLVINAEGIAFNPPSVTAPPTNLGIRVIISNFGRTDVPRAKVVFYEGGMSDTHRIAEQIHAFPGQSDLVVTFSLAVQDAKEHRFYISVDSENEVPESDESNNTALAVWQATPAADLIVRPSDIGFSPRTIKNPPSAVMVQAIIWNTGQTDVPQALVALFEGDISLGNRVGEQTVAIPAQSSVAVAFPVTIADVNDHDFTVSLDPENLVQESDESNNIAPAAWRISIEADLSITGDDISITPSSLTVLPTEAVIRATVWNLGRADVAEARVVLYDGALSEANKKGEQMIAVPGQSSVPVTFSLILRDGNERLFFLFLDPENLVTESDKSNNTAAKLLSPEKTYDLEVLASDLSVSPGSVEMLKEVQITSRIRNKGTLNAYSVQVKYYIDEPGGAFDIATSTVDIPANATITDRIPWRADRTGETLPLTVFVDAFDLFEEVSETNNRAIVYLTVHPITDSNLAVSYQDIVMIPTPASERGTVTLSALVVNDGFSVASNVGVNFYLGVPGVEGVLLGSQFIPSLNAGSSTRVSIDWTNILASGEKLIYLKVDPDNRIKEIREDDNDAFTTLTILSLPDLAVTTHSITFSPAAPREGDTVTLNVVVQNRGEQAVSNVTVRVLEGSTVIGSQVIPVLSGRSQGVATVIYDTAGKSGPHPIWVVVDPENVIVEQSEDNNQASRVLGVQDASLWLTEPYISPNGDGIKDSTQLFFRLDYPQTVRMRVVDEKGNTVRTFNGGELEDTSGGTVTWDGLDEEGRVADDGPYQLQILDVLNRISGSLVVIVDTNRSPITEAVGTKYLLKNNLTCALPDFSWDWVWFPDESGILFNVSEPNQSTPEYPTGLYTLDPDGRSVLRIIPWEWNKITDPIYSYETQYYELSPDGEEIAFALYKQNRNEWGDGLSQLWTVDREGRRLALLDAYEFSKDRGIVLQMKWSPDAAYIAYMVKKVISDKNELWVIHSFGAGKAMIEPDYGDWNLDTLKWSPESGKVAYVHYEDGVSKIRLSDATGVKEDVFSLNGYHRAQQIEWMNPMTLLFSEEGGEVWLVDAGGGGNHLRVAEDLKGSVSISHNRQFIAFKTDVEDTLSLYVSGMNGEAQRLHEFRNDEGCSLVSGEITWSKDSRKIATSETSRPGEGGGGCEETGNLVVVDRMNHQKTLFPGLFGSPQWFSDGRFLLDGLSIINLENGETVSLPAGDHFDEGLSPHENALTYREPVDPSSACYGRGWEDLWSVRSLLNLKAHLRAEKEKSAIILKGIAADLHFEGYRLEYADVTGPNTWNPVAPPSNVPVVDDVFTTWVPPYEGTFYVRLVAWDKAGNVMWDRKRVSWGLSSSITDLNKTLEMFSPNGDGVKDSVELRYRVLEPVHLEFTIFDQRDHPVRTIVRNYVSPVGDYIVWDGRDSNGRTVPDGKYKIKVFSYEFGVEVDNTPPDVELELSRIKGCSLKLDGEAKTVGTCVELYGLAFDHHMRGWVIQYGEGDNPSDWFELLKGEGPLVERGGEGAPMMNPPRETSIRSFSGEHIAWLVGKKLLITAEDFGGNRSTVMTGFLEERLFLDRWDGILVGRMGLEEDNNLEEVESGEAVPAHLARPGLHSFGGFETIRAPIAEMNVQYWNHQEWTDSLPGTNPPQGLLELEWDNSFLPLSEGYAVRVKAIDVLGKEHYSNPLFTESLFYLYTCRQSFPVGARNSLFEDLRILKFQVQSDQDLRYSQWKGYWTFDSDKGDAVPEGDVPVPLPSTGLGIPYRLRMIGTSLSGKTYVSQALSLSLPLDCQSSAGEIRFSIETSGEAGCGEISGRTLLFARIEGGLKGNVPLLTLTYSVEGSDGIRPLRQVDLTREEWGSVTLDTSQMAEGTYSVGATLRYLEGGAAKEIRASKTIFVDRVLPVARLTYPANSTTLCPIKISHPAGESYGVPIEGVATDNHRVERYEISFGIGDNPPGWNLIRVQRGPGQGTLGLWDVTNLRDANLSLRLKVVDGAGNTSCHTSRFSFDRVIDLPTPTSDKVLFSPNGDGALDEAGLTYEIREYATVDVRVFRVLEDQEQGYVLDSTPARTIVSGKQHLGGSGKAFWDGKDDSNTAVPDGRYGISVSATDSCRNTNMKWISVQVDNTPPTVAITYPGPSDPLGNIVEVKGTAEDPRFQSYALEAGQGDDPQVWHPLLSGANPVRGSLFGKWNTFGLEGRWTLRLTATDMAGNGNATRVTIDLGQRKNLVKDVALEPRVFSPNGDGKADAATLRYEVTDACDLTIDIMDRTGSIRKTLTTAMSSAGSGFYLWDGRDDAAVLIPDGVYTVRLTAALSSNPLVTQEESIQVAVDSTSPSLDIRQPLNNAYLKGGLTVTGSITDAHLLEYSVAYTGETGLVLIDRAGQYRENHTFGVVNDLPEGNYFLRIQAKDAGENEVFRNIGFTMDRTAPRVTLDRPGDGEYYGSAKNVIGIIGTVVEKHLEAFSLKYGAGENPGQWIDLVNGNTAPATPQLFLWNVGNHGGLSDGLYTLSLSAKDKAGSTGETKIKVTVDNTPPEAAITAPGDGGYVRTAVEVRGTASDANLDRYILEISEGQCSHAFRWAAIGSTTSSIRDGLLGSWRGLPPDGDYCLRLTAVDKVGNRTEARGSVKVDTHPPVAPVLSGALENKSNVGLTWLQNPEPDLSGYNLYRDSQKVNTALIQNVTYFDRNLKEGVYHYTLKAIDLAGNESGPSNQVKLTVDLTGPEARVRWPQDGANVSGLVDIKGTAFSSEDFKQYRIFMGQGSNPSWTLIRTSPVPIPYGSLTQWDTIGLFEDSYGIKLEAEDFSGNIITHQITVRVDNTPPRVPFLISATPNSSDVTLTWRENTESDLAGYLVYRNGQLANVSGIVVGDLRPYLILGTTYVDRNLADGKVRYHLIALDQAGNESSPSNTLEVEMDTHPPRATVVEPNDGSKFQNKTLIRAETPDKDIASIQFQYKRVQAAGWVNLGGPVVYPPYASSLDPTALGLTFGDHHLRAVATDSGGRTDPFPPSVTLTYTDLIAPDFPKDLRALTHGNDVTLTWAASTEGDLRGYHLYKTLEGVKIRMNSTALAGSSYEDRGLADGSYLYEATAIDTYGNESNPSEGVSIKIYAPSVTQPYTPVGQGTLLIHGTNASANSTVEISIETVTGSVLRVSTPSDEAGEFTGEGPLSLGENKITAKVTDSAGNISRSSERVVVAYNEVPSAPTGLNSSVENDKGNLSWNPNPEPDLAGYNLFRNGERVNPPAAVTSGSFLASSSYSSNVPSRAFDSNPSTYWGSYRSYGSFTPAWWEIDLPSQELINQVEIHWGSGIDYEGKEFFYAGRGYEIQAWSGYAWITLAKVVGNSTKENTFDFKPSYRTDRIRVHITETTDPNVSKQVRIAEVGIVREHLIPQTSYTDLNLSDGFYRYEITAVDYYGFESPPSAEALTAVGDTTPPSAPRNLGATAVASNVGLNWDANAEGDLAGYNIYRNTPQGWVRISTSLMAGNSYIDLNLANGTYRYRVTSVDTAKNESLPSNEASAEISVPLPQPPLNLQVNAVPEGRALHASWESGGAPVLSYQLYRSLIPGGPYQRANAAAILSTSHLDMGLANGTPYYYVVVSVDASGNEGACSNEAMGIPVDTLAPARPSIYFPSPPGIPSVLFKDRTDLHGTAEPGSTVELFKDGIWTGRTVAMGSDSVQNFVFDSIEKPALSPDGRVLAYGMEGSLWLKPLAGGAETQIVLKGSSPLWSPEGRNLVYSYMDENARKRIGLFDLETQEAVPLTTDIDISEVDPSWSSDGRRIAFRSTRGGSTNIWMLDLGSGSMTQVTHGVLVYRLKLSPDGGKVAYTDYQSLFVVDVSSGSTIQVGAETDVTSFNWSPDSERMAFVSYRNGGSEVFVAEMETLVQHQVTDPGGEKFTPVWSPDGRLIAYGKWDSREGDSLWVTSAENHGQETLLQGGVEDPEDLTWARTGRIVYLSGNQLNVIALKGSFTFEGLSLDPGENVFTATATDDSGNASTSSDEITVLFDTRLIPDLEMTSEDIFVYPPYPSLGEETVLTVGIRNRGQGEAREVGVDVYLWDSRGNLQWLGSETVSRMASQAEEFITLPLETTSRAGANRILVVIDAQERIYELCESNNTAIREFFIAEREGLFISTALDSDRYSSDQEVNVVVHLKNSGVEKDLILEAWVEDEERRSGASLGIFHVQLLYASQVNLNLMWNTGVTFAGSYRVHTVLREGAQICAESVVPFTILPDLDIETTVVTDKATYRSRENVAIRLNMENRGRNYPVPELKARVRVLNPENQDQFIEERDFQNLLPGGAVSLNLAWNTQLLFPGDYIVIAEISLGGQPFTSKSVSFRIEPSLVLMGTVEATPAVVSLGNAARVDYLLRNDGNVDANGLVVRVSVVDPQTQLVLNTHEEIMTLGMNAVMNGTFAFSTQGYLLKTYGVRVQAISQGAASVVATGSFAVRDGTAPVVFLLSPASGGLFNAGFDLAVLASDAASGVDRVEYRIDGGLWRFLPASDPASGRYGLTWTPTTADEGPHTIRFRATDRAGNISTVVSTIVTIDLTPPPVPLCLSPPHNTVVTSEVVHIGGSAEPGCRIEMASGGISRSTTASVSGEFIFAGVQLIPGQNFFHLTASDRTGNVSVMAEYALYLRIVPVPNVRTDRPKYYPGKTVTITSSIQNPGETYSLQGLTARIALTNSQGAVLFTHERPIETIFPGQRAEFQALWNTSVYLKGQYTAELGVFEGEAVLAEVTALFEIQDPGEEVTGAVTVQPDPVSRGDDITLSYSLTNGGTDSITDLNVRVVVIDPDTQEVMNTFESFVTLPVSQTVAGTFILSTSDLLPRPYEVIVQVSSVISAGPLTLAGTAFEVKSIDTWARTYGGKGYDMAFSVKQTDDGGSIAAGESWSFRPFFSDAWVIKLDASGRIQWQKTYGGSLHDVIYSIEETQDGGYIMAGETNAVIPFLGLFWVVKIIGSGELQWQKTYGQGWAHSVRQTPEGGYVAAGRNAGGAWIVKLKPNGDILWQKSYRGTVGDWAHSVEQTSEGGLIVAGMMNGEAWVLKLNGAGETQWQKTYGNGCLDANFSIRQTVDGGYIVASGSLTFGAGLTDFWILKLDPNGAIEWQKTYGGAGFDLAHSLEQTQDGGYVVAGWTGSFGAGATDAWVLKLNANGEIEWQKTYGGAGFDLAITIGQTEDGGYVVGGWTDSFGAGNGDMWILKLDANGEVFGCQEGLVGTTHIVPYNTSGTASQCSKAGQNTVVSPRKGTASVTTTGVVPGEVCGE